MVLRISVAALAFAVTVGGAAGTALAQGNDVAGRPPGYEKNTNVPLSYGHYCGVGNSQQGTAPIDALDRACMQHDSCTGNAALPACSCHHAFEAAAGKVARDPNVSDLVHKLATNMIAAIGRVPCTGG